MSEALDGAPIIQGSTTNKERERLYQAFRTGELRVTSLQDHAKALDLFAVTGDR